MTTSQIVKSNNKALEQQFLQSIGEFTETQQKFIEQEQRTLNTVHKNIFNQFIKLDSYKVEKLINLKNR
jgi:hypothetical protein